MEHIKAVRLSKGRIQDSMRLRDIGKERQKTIDGEVQSYHRSRITAIYEVIEILILLNKFLLH